MMQSRDRAPAGAKPTVSIVIAAYTEERWTLIRDAVESSRVQTVPIETIVVCIDNNQSLLTRAQMEWDAADGTTVMVIPNRHDSHLAGRSMHEKAHGESRRFGAGSARNTAVDAVGSDIIAFMDDDAWAEPDWIEQLLAVYRDPAVKAVGGAPVPDFETTRPTWFPKSFDWIFGCAYEGLPTVNAPQRRLIGANMSVRREALVAIGGFFGSDFDDLNVCMRLTTKYGPEAVYYAPGAIVHHYVPAHRISWRYFWRRCYFVNREKVRVFRQIESSSSLAAERDFVWRLLRRGLWPSQCGQSGALRSRAAELAGIVLSGLGHARGRLDELMASGRR